MLRCFCGGGFNNYKLILLSDFSDVTTEMNDSGRMEGQMLKALGSERAKPNAGDCSVIKVISICFFQASHKISEIGF